MSTTRFIYLTDTHIGGDAAGYQMQPRMTGRESKNFAELARWIRSNDISFVIHGGDLTDHGRPDEIEFADTLCSSLGIPVYLSLGNHDVEDPDAMPAWRRSSVWGNPTDGCHLVDADGFRLVIVSHHWNPHTDYHWQADQPQEPRLDARQIQRVSAWVAESDRPVIAITHAPLNDAEHGVTGEPFHPPNEDYLATWRRIASAADGKLKLVMAGHNHVHSQRDHGAFVSCTTSAFSEPPLQFRLVTVDETGIDVQTHALGAPPAAEDTGAWCIGSETNRSFSIAFQ